jgi:type VI secretion system secreted protein Hcp
MKRILSITAILALLLIPVFAHAAMTTLAVNGVRQGVIKGDNTTKGQEDTIVVLALGADMNVPFSASGGGGGATGKLVPGPITITKNVDRATPQLFQAMATGEILKDVYIRFYRTGTDGATSTYFTIKLRNALIVEIKTEGNAQVSGGVKESVSFIWQTMELTDVGTGATTVIDWTGPIA